MEDWAKIQQAVYAVASGVAKRIDVDKETVVYQVGTTIRIDLKNKG